MYKIFPHPVFSPSAHPHYSLYFSALQPITSSTIIFVSLSNVPRRLLIFLMYSLFSLFPSCHLACVCSFFLFSAYYCSCQGSLIISALYIFIYRLSLLCRTRAGRCLNKLKVMLQFSFSHWSPSPQFTLNTKTTFFSMKQTHQVIIIPAVVIVFADGSFTYELLSVIRRFPELSNRSNQIYSVKISLGWHNLWNNKHFISVFNLIHLVSFKTWIVNKGFCVTANETCFQALLYELWVSLGVSFLEDPKAGSRSRWECDNQFWITDKLTGGSGRWLIAGRMECSWLAELRRF